MIEKKMLEATKAFLMQQENLSFRDLSQVCAVVASVLVYNKKGKIEASFKIEESFHIVEMFTRECTKTEFDAFNKIYES